MDKTNQMQQQSMDTDDMNAENENAAQSANHTHAIYDSLPSTSHGVIYSNLMGISTENCKTYILSDGTRVLKVKRHQDQHQLVNFALTNER